MEGGENESKLLKVCSCTGTQELVHYHCLKSWVESSNSKKCSVCKSFYSGIILDEKSATIRQWISNTPSIIFPIIAHILFITFCCYFLLVAFIVSSIAEKSDIFVLFKLILTTFNCMFMGMLVMYFLMAITALVCDYRQFARENRSIQVRGYVKGSEATLTDSILESKDVEKGQKQIQTNQIIPVTESRESFPEEYMSPTTS